MDEQTMTVNYSGAVNAALRRCLAEVPETLLYGEDVAKPGGVHGITRGLWKEFGDRVFDTPISESAILGRRSRGDDGPPADRRDHVGGLLPGRSRPDDQPGGQRPLRVRGQAHRAAGSCAPSRAAPGRVRQHSQNLEALFLHAPGLRVAMPSTPQDAYDIMVSAVYCDDPVVVIDNRTLYFGENRR